jgi:hypothetical protein
MREQAAEILSFLVFMSNHRREQQRGFIAPLL